MESVCVKEEARLEPQHEVTHPSSLVTDTKECTVQRLQDVEVQTLWSGPATAEVFAAPEANVLSNTKKVAGKTPNCIAYSAILELATFMRTHRAHERDLRLMCSEVFETKEAVQHRQCLRCKLTLQLCNKIICERSYDEQLSNCAQGVRASIEEHLSSQMREEDQDVTFMSSNPSREAVHKSHMYETPWETCDEASEVVVQENYDECASPTQVTSTDFEEPLPAVETSSRREKKKTSKSKSNRCKKISHTEEKAQYSLKAKERQSSPQRKGGNVEQVQPSTSASLPTQSTIQEGIESQGILTSKGTKRCLLEKHPCPSTSKKHVSTVGHAINYLDEVSCFYNQFALHDDQGNIPEDEPPTCKLNDSKKSVVEFARFTLWSLKGQRSIFCLLLGKNPDYDGLKNDWRKKLCTFTFDHGFTQIGPYDHACRNKDPLWNVQKRCVPGAFASGAFKFPKLYQGSLCMSNIATDERVLIPLGPDSEMTQCVLVGKSQMTPSSPGTVYGLFLRCDDLEDLISAISGYCSFALQHEFPEWCGLREKPVKMVAHGRGIYFNLLVRAFYPFNSSGGILNFGHKTLRYADVSDFIQFRHNCLFGQTRKSSSEGNTAFLPSLFHNILKRSADNLIADPKNKEEAVLALLRDDPSFSTDPGVLLQLLRNWVKNAYRIHIKTVIARYMNQLNCVDTAVFKNYTDWYNSVYARRSIKWRNTFNKRGSFECVANGKG